MEGNPKIIYDLDTQNSQMIVGRFLILHEFFTDFASLYQIERVLNWKSQIFIVISKISDCYKNKLISN